MQLDDETRGPDLHMIELRVTEAYPCYGTKQELQFLWITLDAGASRREAWDQDEAVRVCLIHIAGYMHMQLTERRRKEGERSLKKKGTSARGRTFKSPPGAEFI